MHRRQTDLENGMHRCITMFLLGLWGASCGVHLLLGHRQQSLSSSSRVQLATLPPIPVVSTSVCLSMSDFNWALYHQISVSQKKKKTRMLLFYSQQTEGDKSLPKYLLLWENSHN